MTKIFPKEYSKKEFVEFLKKNNVNENIITKFVELPESVVRSGDTFDLYINTTWYNVGDTHYEFELNYYSKQNIEYLFSLKVYKDIETSINSLTCELMNGNYIKRTGAC